MVDSITDTNDTKPGYKTTEFWLSLATIAGIFLVVCLGKMDVASAVALGTAALGAAGYAHSRGVTKAASIALLFLILAGCSTAKNERDILREWRLVYRHTTSYEAGWDVRAKEADDDAKVFADDLSLVAPVGSK